MSTNPCDWSNCPMSCRHPIDRPARVVALSRVLNHRWKGWSTGSSRPLYQRGCRSISTCSKTPLGLRRLYHSREISLYDRSGSSFEHVLKDLLVKAWPGSDAPQRGPQVDEVPWLLLIKPEILEIKRHPEMNIRRYPS